jgi:hypothetical protein
MRLKIVSGGAGASTHIVDTDTGAKLKNVVKVVWSCEARRLATCTLELVHVPVEVEGEVASTRFKRFKRLKQWVLGRWSPQVK